MLTIFIKQKSNNPTLPENQKVKFLEIFSEALKQEKSLEKICNSFAISVTSDGLTIDLYSIFTNDARVNKYIERMFTTFLINIGLHELIEIAGLETSVGPEDRHLVKYDHLRRPLYPFLTIETFEPRLEGVNSLMLKDLGIAIPENYKCSLSGKIMDNPVYALCEPNIYFERENLTHLFYLQNEELDPNTGHKMFRHPKTYQLMSLDSIQSNNTLRQEIKQFATHQLTQSFLQQNERWVIKMAFYVSNEKTQENLEKAIRKAAAANDIEALNLFYEVTSEVDAIDNNPDSKRNGLHWAAIKGATEAFKLLIDWGVNPLLPDAKGKSALDYAFEHNRVAIIKLINPNYKPELENNNNQRPSI